MNLSDLLQRYLVSYPRKRQARCLARFKLTFTKLDAMLGEPATIAALKTDTLESLMRYLAEKGHKGSVINIHVDNFSALWNYAHDLRLVDWPAPSPRLRFKPDAATKIVRPQKMQRGRKVGTRRPGKAERPEPTKIDGTLWSYFLHMFKPKRLFGKSPSTTRLYGYSLDYFTEFLGRPPKLKDLTDETIMALMEWISSTEIVNDRQGRGLSVRTANKTRDQLVSLWGFLAKKGVVKTWPEVQAMNQPQQTPIAWSPEELKLLWEMLANQLGTTSGLPSGLYWLTMHCVAWDSMERIGAIRQLKWSDVSPDCVWLHIRGETRKGRRKDFTAKLKPETSALLREIREPVRDLIFPWEQHPSYFWIKYRIMREKAGLPHDRWHSFHCIRKTGASFAEAVGADASKLLGHSSRRITIDHYLDPRLIPQIHAADILPRPDAGVISTGGMASK